MTGVRGRRIEQNRIQAGIRHAWIDEASRLISFHQIRGAKKYCAENDEFWKYIIRLGRLGYRLQ